jgi:diaminohydroxyphosphoribosylaminopyrimidine deaminase/5-amino-6-(5-phosphoribosylamino)uracil reductase
MSARAPFTVTLKLATSLDGMIATRTGASRWITGHQARAQVHRLRAAHDAVVTGIGTVLADDPELTARTDPAPPLQPARIVLDTRARTPLDGRLAKTLTSGPVCLVTGPEAASAAHAAAGFQVVLAPLDARGHVDVAEGLTRAAARLGARRLMVEAGGGVAGAVVRAGLVDRVEWFRAPLLIGGDGAPVLSGLDVAALTGATRWRRLDARPCGDDLWETYAAAGREDAGEGTD